MTAPKKKSKSAAVLTIHDADKMTKKGRREIAVWLIAQAAMLKEHGDQYAKRFTGRYLYGN